MKPKIANTVAYFTLLSTVRCLTESSTKCSYLIKFATSIEKTIIMIMKVQDLKDSRGNPQTPWPLVQPFPNFVPKPTKNPETANPSSGSP